jgi:hypothetical protein
MKKQKEEKRAKRPYIGPRIMVLSAKSAKAKRLVNEAVNEPRNEGEEGDSKVKSELPKAKKRSA